LKTSSVSRATLLLSLFLPMTLTLSLHGQDMDAPEQRALVFLVTSRIIGPDQQVSWEEAHSHKTYSGSVVPLRMESRTLDLRLQFTPYVQMNNEVLLVIQGRIMVVDPLSRNRSFQTTLQTIAMTMGDAILFFPLGGGADASHPSGSHTLALEIMVEEYQEPGLPAPENLGPGTTVTP